MNNDYQPLHGAGAASRKGGQHWTDYKAANGLNPSPSVKRHETPQTRSPKTNLHPAQFNASSGSSSQSNSGRHGKPYEGKRRAPYSPGKDIGGSVGASKKPEYTGRHSGPAEGKHGKAYNFDVEASNTIGKGKGPDYIGRHRPKPQGEGKHGKPYDADRDIHQSMKTHKKDYVGKHSARYKPEKKIGQMPSIHFRPSRHAGKNKEHLKALVK